MCPHTKRTQVLIIEQKSIITLKNNTDNKNTDMDAVEMILDENAVCTT